MSVKCFSEGSAVTLIVVEVNLNCHAHINNLISCVHMYILIGGLEVFIISQTKERIMNGCALLPLLRLE